ncbi:hypothetical protein HQ305_16765 [Rhodococcus sp. BP-149]|uniref:hypothetical protein n=1 Tax=unclassified Rhodococcus (in: high G+C Gram-positive bacteria) TaxID=192944 RepID=UPI001C9A9193|nr:MULTISPECIES: hypothetical protein [unclassified Rhodococcus (in: high G+C Gram-positive bacteria)]MBY6687213.1 hypothetical protein [Rhodococcus sp. BP-288]MBY6694364.1 hypothetical protein [Rhodococcus sp. BP-188]MBY6698073.1 hypothetical protein [Rhodococcus sp. BP-285]MBY6704293.1 hypothetical protein [Rhodococcus sp. BP-283]MBY6712942.1 hypothetical protein [Rhodococcus sp. BP-160]
MTPYELSLQPVEELAAREAIARTLALPDKADDETRRCEMLRAVTWASTSGDTPVYIGKLLNRAVSVDKSINPKTLNYSDSDRRAGLRNLLDVLADLGDLAELANGYWVSVPGVVVKSETREPELLVSGIPLRLLDRASRDGVACAGAARHIIDQSLLDNLGLPQVGLWMWANKPESTLSTWTADFIGTTRIVDGQLDDTEFYLADSEQRASIQAIRWKPSDRKLTGTYLYRHTVLRHWRVYGLARVAAGVVTGTCDINRDDARRLMYGYDQIANNPVKATWRESAEGVSEVVLQNPIPAPEMRALTALGRRLPASKFEYRFAATSHRSQIRRTLENLGIQINKEVKHG